MRSAGVSAAGPSDRHPGPLCALHRLILTAREPAQLRHELIDFGCSQIDPGSRIEIGGYSEQREQQDLAREQFRIGDCRPLGEVVSELLQMGEIPCWCTACYRKGRTGEHFMEFAIPGFIKRLYALWHLVAMTRMRRGEAIGLRWSDVDLENARLAVRRALIPTNRDVVVSEPKTAKGRRVVALDPATVEVLKGQAARQLGEQQEWDKAWVETGLVFTQENGKALDPESVSRYFRQAVKKSLLPQMRLHDLRHTHATLALQAGIHPKVVSERPGHATVSITLDTYSHAIPALQEEAAALIAGLVFAGE